MNELSTVSSGWSRRQFWGVAGIIFLTQAALVLVFGGGRSHATIPLHNPTEFSLLDGTFSPDQLSKMFFASDPTVFLLPSRHGFTGRSWLNVAPQFELPERTEQPAWLGIKTDQLGTNFPALKHEAAQLMARIGQTEANAPEAWPPFLPEQTFQTNSTFEIEGGLAERALNPPSRLPSWPSQQLLRRSVVQIAVNSAGQVVSARLQEPRSGLLEADNRALQLARTLRFRPVPVSSPVWGRAVFHWETAAPTNVGAIVPP